MNKDRLKEIILATTNRDWAEIDGFQKVDMVVFPVVVDMAKAQERRAELAELLTPWAPGLSVKPSMILWQRQMEMIGLPAEDAYHLVALGEFLKLWKVIRPDDIGLNADKRDVMNTQRGHAASMGYMFTDGFTP